MLKFLKNVIRNLFVKSNLPVTKNITVDIKALRLLKAILKPDDNCIDIGAHDGDFLRHFMHIAPEGKHYAFEPIPTYYNVLKKKLADNKKVTVHPFALSNENGQAKYHFVKNAPAYSGLKKRDYDISSPDIEMIEVETRTLDSVLPKDHQYRVMKIDVEGAELQVLQGATEILQRNNLLILFEFGKGAANHYGVTPKMMYDFFLENGYHIYRIEDYAKIRLPLNLENFNRLYEYEECYFYVAAKK